MLERRKTEHWYELFTLGAESQVGHGNSLEYQHEYNECNRRDESAKECARQDNVDKTKAKGT